MGLFSKKPISGGVEYLIVGLGNPDRKYENTRHNAGFMAVDVIAAENHCSVDRLKYKSLTGQCTIAGHKCLLMKPTTYMNLSGQAVVEAMNFYKIPPERVIVLFDDISLDVGKLRIRRKGSHGGHNGMKNIIYLSGKDTFPRIKIGVGKKPHPEYDLADWVLSAFRAEEQKLLAPVLQYCAEAVALMVEGKTDQAMNQFNS
ncbi:Peptidyl-tRNA hydrolase [uncultured Ruminococcus sp.]|uniref:Peptidyl-tRNA hydrolase n=1 Tax=Massiliimalia timonensis TaxID=1987501 RepID=A0A8J6TQ74_9FIRM|nr:aminoacyl-tRNA hydrolase [Massiliimalia timonensis]MBC8610839.1 aminoacyl-tRNA hydrolase [Massiliimalia timonensis]MBS7175914.1 aminoacyl-tRNA hydrolase [Clostridiales bacterium]SCI00632.1 Peptidyl-tRNA hydrolase [uncultured Clostridium sp.]SCI17830.1 Peptidyl-tRNA hydrolase [uncultured Ruminococcus sp.]